MLKIILLGYGELASSLLLGIVNSGHKLVGVMRWEKAKHSGPVPLAFKEMIFPNNFNSLVKAFKIPEIKAKSANSEQFKKQVLALHPDIILIGCWGEVLKKETILLPKIACINCHPSLLPTHRGSNPYASVIKEGETKTGVTFHLVDETLDTGPILMQQEVPVLPDDTGGSLRIRCAIKAREMVKPLFDGLETGIIIPVAQNHSKSSYYPRLGQNDVMVNWNNSAAKIHNHIRGVNPWIYCYTSHKNTFLKIFSSKIVNINDTLAKPGQIIHKKDLSLTVATAEQGKAIIVDGLEIYRLPGKLWSRLYIDKKIKIGDVLWSPIK